MRNRLAGIGLLMLACGCVSSAPEVETSLAEKSTRPTPSVDACLERLLQSPVIETDEATPESISRNRGIPVPSPESLAADGRRYELLLDHESGRVWIRVRGGIGDHLHSLNGPWPLADANVRALLKAMEQEPSGSQGRSLAASYVERSEILRGEFPLRRREFSRLFFAVSASDVTLAA